MAEPRTVGGRACELDFEDRFEGDSLDLGRWLPHYLPHWSGRRSSAARYRLEGGHLKLLIEADQQPWCPEFDGAVRVSSLQTGVFAGALGVTSSRIGPRQDGSAPVRGSRLRARLPASSVATALEMELAEPPEDLALS